MNIINIRDRFYQASYTSSNVLNALEDVNNIGLDRECYLLKSLNKKIKKIL